MGLVIRLKNGARLGGDHHDLQSSSQLERPQTTSTRWLTSGIPRPSNIASTGGPVTVGCQVLFVFNKKESNEY